MLKKLKFIEILFFPFLLLIVIYVRFFQKKRRNPKVVWGPTPIISIKYFSKALNLKGINSQTVVNHIYNINKKEDFDIVFDLNHPKVKWIYPVLMRKVIIRYIPFIWAIIHYDVFNFFSDGGFLQNTIYKYWEFQTLRWCGKKIILSAYGADVQIIGEIPNLLFKHTYLKDYPTSYLSDFKKKKRLYYFSKFANHVISGVDWVYYLPKWDSLLAGNFVIDIDSWSSNKVHNFGEEKFKILHAPNHRNIKGSDLLIKAVEELKMEGLKIELILLEKVSNDQIKLVMDSVDLVADQFIVGWYAMFAIEAMALKKPVLTFLSPDLLELHRIYSYVAECPIINTHPLEIKNTIKNLYFKRETLKEIGEKGRNYVEKYHSLEFFGNFYKNTILSK